MVKFPLAGLQLIEKLMLGIQTSVLLKAKLFINQLCVTDASVYADFIICDCPGYDDFTLTPADWVLGNFDAGTGQATYPQIVFNFLDNPQNETVYGYIIFEQSSSTVVWADTFRFPFVPMVDGENLPLNITLFDSNVPKEKDCYVDKINRCHEH